MGTAKAELRGSYGTPTGVVGGGQAALIAMFYFHIIFYLLCEATVYIYYGEVMPNHLRAKSACLGLAFTNLTAVWQTWATPTALATIGYKYWVRCFLIFARSRADPLPSQ